MTNPAQRAEWVKFVHIKIKFSTKKSEKRKTINSYPIGNGGNIITY